MLFHRELLVIIAGVAAAASASEHHLRGSGDVAEVVEELPSDLDYYLVDVEEKNEERELAKDNNGNGRGGGNSGNGQGNGGAATTTVAPIATAGGAEAPIDGGAEAPIDGGGDTTVVTEPVAAVCEPACDDRSQICAQSSPDATAQCYPKCSAFPMAGTCSEMCVHSVFTCEDSSSVMNELCECFSDGTYGCRLSDCGLFI